MPSTPLAAFRLLNVPLRVRLRQRALRGTPLPAHTTPPFDRQTTSCWALFAASGVLFLVAAMQDGDPLLLWGSITWLVGVAAFLVGYSRRRNP